MLPRHLYQFEPTQLANLICEIAKMRVILMTLDEMQKAVDKLSPTTGKPRTFIPLAIPVDELPLDKRVKFPGGPCAPVIDSKTLNGQLYVKALFNAQELQKFINEWRAASEKS